MLNATQTPTLFYEPEERGSKVIIRRKAPHYTGNGEVIARRVELSDAQEIVSAVNSREAMINALRPFANMLPDTQTPNDALQAKLQEWCKAARAALVKAGAE